MSRAQIVRRWGFVYLVIGAACSAGMSFLGGCSSERYDVSPASLRNVFPEHAPRVLDNDVRVVATEHDFVLHSNARPIDLLELSIPRQTHEAIRMRTVGGFEIAVREVEVEGTAEAEDHAVVYRRAGGVSYWTKLPSGAEEWLVLEPAAIREDEPVARWVIEGGLPQQKDHVVDIVDDEGRARVRVSAPEAYSESGKKVPIRLAANAEKIELYVEPMGERVLVDPVWIAITMPMQAERRSHAAVLLDSGPKAGQVLVTGGHPPGLSTPLSTSEFFEYNPNLPENSTWTLGNPMNGTRYHHTMTRLSVNATHKGKVLVVGGYGSASASAEVFDPGTGHFYNTINSMQISRWRHTATEMLDGRVLAVGGNNTSGAQAAVDTFDPDTNTWSSAKPLLAPATGHAAVLLDNPMCGAEGCVVVLGGDDGTNVLASISVFNLQGNKDWTSYPSAQFPDVHLQQPRKWHTATLLPNGKILVIGGTNGAQSLLTAELCDLVSGCVYASSMTTPRADHEATVLVDGRVLVTGGANQGAGQKSAEIYDPITNSWQQPFPDMNVARDEHTATQLQNGKVLVAGGQNNGVMPMSEIADIAGIGAPCMQPSDCASGYCVDGVCCDTACNGPCLACSVAAGAPMDGTCAPATEPCNDNNPCTENDVCSAGVCTGTPKTCPITNQCLASGTCNVVTGMCEYTTKPNGSACNDGNACTLSDTCQMGVCSAGTPMVCPAPDQCHNAGSCDPATGTCTYPTKPNGTACSDANACTLGDTCQMGICTSGAPKTCTPLSQCHNAGTCNQATGVCSNPAKPNGTACNDANACTSSETCQNGSCSNGTQKVCPPPDQCHNSPGTCSPSTGLCSYPNKVNGTNCNDGNACSLWDACWSGVCNGTLYECYDGSDNNNNRSVDEGTCKTVRAGVEPYDNLEVVSSLGKGWVVTGIGGVVDNNNIVGLTVWRQRINSDGTLGATGKDVIGSAALEAYAKVPAGYLVVGVSLGGTKSTFSYVKLWYRKYDPTTRSLSSTLWSTIGGGGAANATWIGWDASHNAKQLRRIVRNVGARVGDNMLRTMEITHCQLSPWP